MKKLPLMLALLLVMVGALVLPAAAQDDAHPLAGYFPADAPMYLEVRTDDEFLAELDALVSKFVTLMPGSIVDDTLLEVIDEGVSNIEPGGTFATTIRTWLGDEAAIGLYEVTEDMSDDDQPILVVISITDQAAAEEFFIEKVSPGGYEMSEEDGYTLYTPESGFSRGQPHFIFRDDVAILTTVEAVVEAGGMVDGSLSSSDAFTTAANLLPESEYGVFGYIDTPAIFNASMNTRMMPMGADELAMFDSLLGALQPQAFGLTKLGDNGLVIDFASPISLDADSPFSMTATEPIDPAFAERIRASSALVVQGTNLYQSYQTGMESLNAMTEMMANNPDFDAQDMETALWGLRFAVRGLTGMEIDDAIGWMTGDYAFAVGLAPAFADGNNVMAAMDALPVDFVLVVEATDENAAQALYDGLKRSLTGLQAEEIEISEATMYESGDALVITITSDELPYPIEIFVAANNGVFAIGTPRMVISAINPGLDTEDEIFTAPEMILDNASSYVYVGANGLQPLARVMSASSNPESIQDDGKMLKQILGLIDSLSISASVEADGSAGVSRFVWTLPE